MSELENRPVAIARPAARCRAVEVARPILDKFGIGQAAIVGRSRKVVKNGFRPFAARSRLQLEGDASTIRASFARRAIEIACLIEDNFVPWARPVLVAIEKTVQHLQGPAPSDGGISRQLEDRTDIVGTAVVGSAIQTAG